MNTESRLALSAMRIASFLFLRLSVEICVQINLRVKINLWKRELKDEYGFLL